MLIDFKVLLRGQRQFEGIWERNPHMLILNFLPQSLRYRKIEEQAIWTIFLSIKKRNGGRETVA